jgi:predicted ATPase
MLKRLRICGFRSIREQEIELSALNVLIGTNGAGKSNLVAFFDMLSFLKTGGLQEYVARSGSADALLHYGSRTTPVLSFSIDFAIDRGINLYEGRLAHAAGDTLIFVDERVGYKPIGGVLRWSVLGAGHTESKLEAAAELGDKTAQNVLWQLRRCNPYHFHDTSAQSRIRNKSYIEDNKYLRHDGGNLAAYLFRLSRQSPDTYSRIVRTVRQIVPDFSDFELGQSVLDSQSILLNWRQHNREYLFGPHQFSDGTLRVIALTTALVQPPSQSPIMTIIDEPELGLHPYAIAVIAAFMKSAATTTQIIASTQSTTFLDQFDASDVIVIDRESGASTFKRPDADTLKDWLSEYSMGELWQKNVIGGRPS